MKILISKIVVSGRARKDFVGVPELAKSIASIGLLHPIGVQRLDDGTFKLAYGERRLRAHLLLQKTEIEATLTESLEPSTPRLSPEIETKLAELEENVRRQDFSWPEQVECLRQYHALKQQLHGVATNASTNTGWGVRDTASALGMSAGKVSSHIKVAETIRSDPTLAREVRKLPLQAARKKIEQLLEQRELESQLAGGQITISTDLLHGDCTQLIDTLDDCSVDLLLTDPPFASIGIQATCTSHTAAYNLNTTNVGTVDSMTRVFEQLFPKLACKLKPGAHIYVFTGMGEMYSLQMKLLASAGFLVDELPLIWDKGMVSMPAKDYHYMSSYQGVIFGHTKVRSRSLVKPVPNVLRFTAPAHQNRVHPMQLPEDLLQLLIRNSSMPGQLVLDCFAGSGAVLAAARSLGRKAIGFELDDGNYARAQAWLSGSDKLEESLK